MCDDKFKEADTKPELSSKDIDGLLGWVQKQKDKSEKDGKPWSWILALIASLLVFLPLAFAAYGAWKKGREIAKLKHKIDVDEEAKRRERVREIM